MKCSGILFSFYLAKGASCPPYRWHIFRPIFCLWGKKKKSLKNLHPPRAPPPRSHNNRSLSRSASQRVVAFCCLLSVYLLPRKFPWLVFFMISLVIKAMEFKLHPVWVYRGLSRCSLSLEIIKDTTWSTEIGWEMRCIQICTLFSLPLFLCCPFPFPSRTLSPSLVRFPIFFLSFCFVSFCRWLCHQTHN